MEVVFKEGGKVTIKDMPMTLFDAVQEILWKAQSAEWRESDGKVINETGITCCLDKECHDSLCDINWTF